MTEGLKSEALSFWNLFFEKIPPACLNEAHLPLQGRLFSAKRRTKSSSLSALCCFFQYTEKRYRGKSRYLSWRRRRDSTGFQPVVFALRTVYFMSLFAPQKDGRRVRVSLPFLHYTEKRYRGKSRYLFWRRRRDSNSRAGYPTYALSRGASSPTWVLLHTVL